MSEPLLELWIKAGADGSSLGGDPVSQQLFMILLLKRQNPDCLFNVRTLNEAELPEDFKNAGLRKAPAITHGDDIAISRHDEIVEHIDRTFPVPSLKYNNPEADGATADLFRAFCYFIKEVNKDPKDLLNELYRLDQYLAHSEYKFLTSDKMQHIDCIVLPKLHGIRIASRALKDFEIPVDLNNVWRYLNEGYQHEAFQQSCPSDQEIILYWSKRKNTPDFLYDMGSFLVGFESTRGNSFVYAEESTRGNSSVYGESAGGSSFVNAESAGGNSFVYAEESTLRNSFVNAESAGGNSFAYAESAGGNSSLYTEQQYQSYHQEVEQEIAADVIPPRGEIVFAPKPREPTHVLVDGDVITTIYETKPYEEKTSILPPQSRFDYIQPSENDF